MSQALGTLSIDLVARLARLEEGLKRAGTLNERAAAQIEARWAQLGDLGRSFVGGLATAFSATAFVNIVRGANDAVDALNDAKDATGSTIEKLSGLDNIARANGGTLDDVTAILVKFNGVLNTADGKNGVSQALKAIGLDAAELRRMDPADALQATATALAGYADNGKRARLEQVLFGESIRKAAPFLNDLAAAGKINGTVTDEQAAAAERFNKQLAAMQTEVGNFTRSLTSEMLPGLLNLAGRLNEASKAFGGFFSGLSGALFGPMQFGTLAAVREEIGRIEKSMAAYQGGNGAFGAWSVSKAQESLTYLRQLESYYMAVIRLKNANTGQDDPTELARRGRGVKTVSGLPDQPFGATTPAGPLPPALGAIRDAKNQYLVDFLRSEKAAYDQVIEQAQAAPYGPEIDVAELQRRNSLTADLSQLLASLPSAQVQRLKDLQAELNAQYAEGKVTVGDYKAASDELQATLGQLEGKTIDVAGGIEDALGNSLRSALQGDFEGIGQAWTNMLMSMVAQAAQADLMNALTGKGTGGNLLGLFSGFGSFLGIPGFASGGDHLGGVRIVGERGPELEYTGPSRILNANDTRRLLAMGRRGQSGGAPTIYVEAGVGRAELYEAVQAGYRAAQADSRRLLRQGEGAR